MHFGVPPLAVRCPSPVAPPSVAAAVLSRLLSRRSEANDNGRRHQLCGRGGGRFVRATLLGALQYVPCMGLVIAIAYVTNTVIRCAWRVLLLPAGTGRTMCCPDGVQ
jgi:hypothetical protein